MTKDSRVSRRQNKNKKQNKKKPLWKKIIQILIIIMVVCVAVVGIVFIYFIATAPKIDPDKLDVSYATQFYDEDGENFGSYGEEQRIKVTYDELESSEYLVDAVTATEDARFFKHHGIDLRRILGAIKANILYGFGSEGASTITQQVVENMFLTPEKSLKLKVQEQWLALQLERKYSKEEILEMYLNKIFYGNNAYGIKKAAEVYFDKEDLSELTLTESAMLAGLPQRPSGYNPFENPDIMQKRVSTVLKLMVRHGAITEKQAEEANAVDVKSTLTDKKPETNQYDSFMEKVEDELREQLNDTKIFTSGLKVYTTLDRDAQEYVEFLLKDSEENPINYPDDDLQAGVAVVDTETGAVKAIGGGRNRQAKNFNYAYSDEDNAGQQPGSVFKPLVAYGPAIEYDKWSTYHQLNDDKPYDKTETPINNVDFTHKGWVSMRTALEKSINVAAVKAFDEIDSSQAKSFAEGLGISFNDETLNVRDAIGGTSTNVTPLTVAGAYAAFGNEGIYTAPYAVEKVEFPDGTVMEMTPDSEAAMSDYTAYMMTDMLKDVMKSGTGVDANVPNLPLAGKTGTAVNDDGDTNNKWFSGYTTNYSITVWSGYDDFQRPLDTSEKQAISSQIFKHTMTKLSEDIETKDFVKPDSVVSVDVEKGTNPPELPSEFTPSDNIISELFVKGTEPSKTSKTYDEVEKVKDLKAKYDEKNNAIDLTWSYDDDKNIEYIIKYQNDKSTNETVETKDKSLKIDDVEKGTNYTFSVIAKDTETSLESEPVQTDLTIDAEDLGKVKNLNATFDETEQSIQVSWSYDGEADEFEVSVNGQTETTSSNQISIPSITSSGDYEIAVTPIKEELKGDTATTTVKVEIDNDNDNENEGEDEGNDSEDNGDSSSEDNDNNSNDSNENND